MRYESVEANCGCGNAIPVVVEVLAGGEAVAYDGALPAVPGEGECAGAGDGRGFRDREREHSPVSLMSANGAIWTRRAIWMVRY